MFSTLQRRIWFVNLGLTSFFLGKDEQHFIRTVVFSLERNCCCNFGYSRIKFNPPLNHPTQRAYPRNKTVTVEMRSFHESVGWENNLAWLTNMSETMANQVYWADVEFFIFLCVFSISWMTKTWLLNLTIRVLACGMFFFLTK